MLDSPAFLAPLAAPAFTPHLAQAGAAEICEIRPGRRVNLLVRNGAAKPACTVFFCHGAGGNHTQWRHQIAAAAAAGARVVAWDFPGHGGSPAPATPAGYQGVALIEDFAALLSSHGAGKLIFAAHSYGTILTLGILFRLALAGQLPRVGGALLLAPPGPGADLSTLSLAQQPLWLLNLLRPLVGRAFRRRAWHAMANPALIRAEKHATHRNSLRMMQALLRQAAICPAADLASLAGLRATILAGAADRLFPPAAARALADLLPGASFETYRLSGHYVMLEEPEAVSQALRALF